MLSIETTLDENEEEHRATMTILHSMGGVVVALYCIALEFSCFFCLGYRRAWKVGGWKVERCMLAHAYSVMVRSQSATDMMICLAID